MKYPNKLRLNGWETARYYEYLVNAEGTCKVNDTVVNSKAWIFTFGYVVNDIALSSRLRYPSTRIINKMTFEIKYIHDHKIVSL